MFVRELDERSSRLVDGARAMRAGELKPEQAGAMMREGHTVKGTSRVMGYHPLSVAGHLLEHVWRGIQKGEIQPDVELARALEMASRAIPDAGRIDPDALTRDLAEAVQWLAELAPDFDLPELPAPADAGEAHGSPSEVPPPVQPPADVAPPAPEPEAVPEVEPEAVPEVEPEPVPEVDAAPEPEPSPDPPLEPVAVAAGHDGGVAAAPRPDPPPLTLVVDNAGPIDEPAEEPAPVRHEEPAADAPHQPATPAAAAPRHDRSPRPRPTGPLGEVIAAVEQWATEQTTLVNAGRLFELMNLAAELRLESDTAASRVQRTMSGADAAPNGAVQSTAAVRDMTAALQVLALSLSAVPVSQLTSQLHQVANFLAGRLGKKVELVIEADEHLAADRDVVEHLTEALRQLVVNAVYHGIEAPAARTAAGKDASGRVTISVIPKDRMLDVVVTDDGAGIDWDLVRGIAVEDGRIASDADDTVVRNVLFEHGFSTLRGGDTVGEGAGLATVSQVVEHMYGRVVLHSTPGKGTEIRLTVPAWRSLQRVLVVDAGGVLWGVPEAAVDDVRPMSELQVEGGESGRTIQWGEHRLPVAALATLMGGEEAGPTEQVVIVRHRVGSAAVAVEGIDGVREIAVAPATPSLPLPKAISGVAFLGAEVALVASPASLVATLAETAAPRGSTRVLVVDDSMGARAVVSGSLASSGFTTSVAASVAEALEVLDQISIDALVVDYAMPHADGVELVEEVRRRHDRLPIVMLSGVAEDADRQRALGAGVDVIFDKAEFREGELAKTLWDLVAR